MTSAPPRTCTILARGLLSLAVLGFALPAAAADYGEYGQWSWWADATLGTRSESRQFSELEESTYSEDGIRVFAGVSGFVLDPMVAAFELALDTTMLQQQGGVSGDWTTFGYSGRVQILPFSALPLEARASKTKYDYVAASTEDPLVLFSRPVDSNMVGFKSVVKQGPLRGLLVDLQSISDTTAAPNGEETLDQSFGIADWSRGGWAQQHARIDYTDRKYSELDFSFEELSGIYTLTAKPAPEWTWNLTSAARQSSAGSGSGANDSFGRFGVATQINRQRESGRSLSFGYSGDVARPNGGALFHSHLVSSSMSQPLGASTWVTPSAAIGFQQGEAISTFIPQGAVAITHSRSWGRTSVSGTAGIGYSMLSYDYDGVSGDESRTTSELSLTASFAGPGTSGSSLEAYRRSNDFRTSEDPVSGLPGDTIDFSGAGTLDRTGARFRNDWHRGSLNTSIDLAWEQTESSSGFSTNSVSADSTRVGLQAGGAWLGFTLGAGSGEIRSTELTSIEYKSASVYLSPLRNLRLTASYRTDTQLRRSTPDFDSIIWNVGGAYQIGLLAIGVEAFDTRTDVVGSGLRHDSGYRATISRSFGGLLPIITTPKQRGVVR